jgi:hypothetical protein
MEIPQDPAAAASPGGGGDEEARVLEWLKRLVELEKAGERTTVALGPFTAYTIIGALQLAMRHPDQSPKIRQVLRDFVHQFEPLFAGTPGEETIRRGMHPEWDVPHAG